MHLGEILRELALARANDLLVKDVRIGLRYTAVMLEDGSTGVAYNFSKRVTRGCPALDSMLPLASKKARGLITLIDSGHEIESSLAIATANALLNKPEREYLDGDILRHLALRPDDTVAMVGYFAPLVPALRANCSDIKIFDQVSRPGGEVLPADEAVEWIAKSEVALVTATAIINRTIDYLLKACSSCREVVILGPSSPLEPEAFRGTPVTLLSGIVIHDGEEILRRLSEGGGTRQFRGCSKKVNLRVNVSHRNST